MAPDVSYRFADQKTELAKSKRAGCQNSQCKKDEIKIGKGEYRMGTLVTIRDHQTWMWKHWGCVTPAQIKRIQDMVEGLDLDVDLDVLDGWDEIDETYQDKIRQAIKVGHVDDEDWRGDPELNRPGQKGINKRTPKKLEYSEEDREPAGTPTKKANKKSKAKNQSESEDEAPPKKKAATRKRKAEPESADDEPVPKKKVRAKKAAKALKEEEDEDMIVAKPAPKKKGRVKKEPVEREDDEEMDDDEPAPKRPPRTKKELANDLDAAAAQAPTLKKGRGKAKPKAKAVKHEDDESEDDEIPLPAPKAAAKKGRGKKVKAEPEPEPGSDSDLNVKPQDTKIKPEHVAANPLSIPQTDGPADDEDIKPPSRSPLPAETKRTKNTAIKQEGQDKKTAVKRESVFASVSSVNGVNAIKAEPDSEGDEESVPKTKVKKEGSSEWVKGDKVKKEKKGKEKGTGNGWVDVKREDVEAGGGMGEKKETKVKKEKGKGRKVKSEA